MATAPRTTAPPIEFDQYVVLDTALVVFAKRPPAGGRDIGRSSQMQTIDVPRGRVLPHPEWIADTEEESLAVIEKLLALGSIARKADVDDGTVTVPAESAFDEEGHPRPVEQRPPTLLAKVNRMRQLDGNPTPIQYVMVGPPDKQRPLVQREVQPVDARPQVGEIERELVPAARSVQ